MRILLTNDDGYVAEGLQVLCDVLSKDGSNEIYVVAPKNQQSSTAHSMHIGTPITIDEIKVKGAKKAWAIDGTPVDCIKIALEHLLEEKPDYVISGINKGANLGTDIYYSGTFGGAAEAVISGISAMAVSLAVKDGEEATSYEPGANLIAGLLRKILPHTIDRMPLLNINIPNLPPDLMKELKPARLSVRIYKNDYSNAVKDGNREIVHLGGPAVTRSTFLDDDVRLVEMGHPTITPVSMERDDLFALFALNALMDPRRVVD